MLCMVYEMHYSLWYFLTIYIQLRVESVDFLVKIPFRILSPIKYKINLKCTGINSMKHNTTSFLL